MPNPPPLITVGSHQDIYNRLVYEQLPSWFGTDHAVLDTILEGLINTGMFNYQQYLYVVAQQRLQTATEDNLDLISKDYLGDELPRRAGEDDTSYRNRISATLLQEKATRFGMDNALYILTGFHPVIFEPWNPQDCGGYNVADFPQTIGYSTHGSYGSGSYAYQCFIDVYVSPFQGMGSYSGYNDYFGGYNAAGDTAQLWYGGASEQTTIISDADIYKVINLTKVEGTVCWVSIHRNAVQ